MFQISTYLYSVTQCMNEFYEASSHSTFGHEISGSAVLLGGVFSFPGGTG